MKVALIDRPLSFFFRAIISVLLTGCSKINAEDLIPTKPGKAPNYWCTWSAQNYMFGIGDKTVDFKGLRICAGAQHARMAMNENNVFGPARMGERPVSRRCAAIST